MTRRESELLKRVYLCVNRLGTVGPRNPMDIGGLAKADAIVAKAALHIGEAISQMGWRELTDAEATIADAEAMLGLAPPEAGS